MFKRNLSILLYKLKKLNVTQNSVPGIIPPKLYSLYKINDLLLHSWSCCTFLHYRSSSFHFLNRSVPPLVLIISEALCCLGLVAIVVRFLLLKLSYPTVRQVNACSFQHLNLARVLHPHAWHQDHVLFLDICDRLWENRAFRAITNWRYNLKIGWWHKFMDFFYY